MVLPSQTARPRGRKTHMHNNRPPRRIRRGVVAIMLVLVGVLAGVRFFVLGDTPAGDNAVVAAPREPDPSQQPPGKAEKPAPAVQPVVASDPPPTPAQPKPKPKTVPVASKPALPPSNQPPTPGVVRSKLDRGLDLANANRPVEARLLLSQALLSGKLSPADAEFAREAMQTLNRRLVFGPQVLADDPYTTTHVVGPNQRLSGIVADAGAAVDWRFVLRINGMRDARSLRQGQRLKLVTGPFHAVVDKSDYRLDLWMGSGAQEVYVTSFAVGLGEFDRTPTGRFRVRPRSKTPNPAWVNPITRERYGRDDPANPIGEYWIGIEGLDDANRELDGFGIHGTIEPESIGTQASMGCVRLLPDDIAVVYEVLTSRSLIEIRQ